MTSSGPRHGTTSAAARRSVDPALDRRIGDLAERQHGVVARHQLIAIGLGRSGVAARTRRGWLRPVHRGVYAVGRASLDDRGRWMAAVLAVHARVPADARRSTAGREPVRSAALLSHGSAAALHGLLPARDRGAVAVTTALPHRAQPGIRLHRSRVLDVAASSRDGIPCTTVARTLVDIAGLGNDVAFERAWSAAASRGVLRPTQIERELHVAPRRSGTALVRAAWAQDHGYLRQRSRSENERAALRLCRDFGLPRPHANRLLRIGDRTFEADLLWPEARLIVEVDGDATHGHVVARRNDRGRDLTLQLAGWRTIRIGESELTVDRAATAALLRAALGQPALTPAPNA